MFVPHNTQNGPSPVGSIFKQFANLSPAAEALFLHKNPASLVTPASPSFGFVLVNNPRHFSSTFLEITRMCMACWVHCPPRKQTWMWKADSSGHNDSKVLNLIWVCWRQKAKCPAAARCQKARSQRSMKDGRFMDYVERLVALHISYTCLFEYKRVQFIRNQYLSNEHCQLFQNMQVNKMFI